MQEAVEAERAGRGTGHFIGYIYEVRADNNFYGAASSYFEYVDTYGDNAGRILAGALATYQSEYLAHRRIPPENIRRVTRVYHNGITGETTTTEYSNARYVSQQTRANPNPYTSRRSVASIVGTLVRMAPVIGACMARQAESSEPWQPGPNAPARRWFSCTTKASRIRSRPGPAPPNSGN